VINDFHRAIVWQRYLDNGISIFDRGDAVTIWNGRDYKETRQSRGAAGAWGQREQEEKQEGENKRAFVHLCVTGTNMTKGFSFQAVLLLFQQCCFAP
jgi:hypothetical protein